MTQARVVYESLTVAAALAKRYEGIPLNRFEEYN